MGERRINLPVVIVLIVVFVALSGFGIYYHQKIYLPHLEEDIKNAQLEVRETGPQKAGSRTLLAELKENSIQLYRDGDYVILVHDGQETEFTDWNKNFGRRTPEIYYYDFIGDGKEDIVIRAFEGEDEATGEALYGFYVLSVNTDKNGKHSYVVNYTNDAGWSSEFNRKIKCYANQLPKSPKRIQFVMAYAGTTVSYDKETELVVNKTPTSYKLVPFSPKGDYCTMKNWYDGPCVVNIDPKTLKVTVDISVYIAYNELSNAQLVGKIQSGLTFKDGGFVIAEKSVLFNAENASQAIAPVREDIEAWSKEFVPKASFRESKVISNIALGCSFNYVTGKTDDLKSISNLDNEAAGISKITVNQEELRIQLKSGYSFSKEITKPKNCQVIIRSMQKDYNITDSAEITTEGENQVLLIRFDSPYSKVEMNKFKIMLGNN